MPNSPDIKYLNKDFSTFRSDLIEYAKSYYPTVYNDFNQASPGSMFIEMASYVGDVLSFYLDNQIQESYLQYAKQKSNLYAMSYMMGYTPKVTAAATVTLDVFQVVPSKTGGDGLQYPDWDYALIINPGMIVRSNVDPSVNFYVPSKVDFTTSSSFDDTVVSVYSYNGSGIPTNFLLKKKADAISGDIKTKSVSFGTAQRYSTIELTDQNIVSVISVQDSSGNKWYEVPYLAQDTIDNPVKNTAASYPNLYQSSNQVPYILEKVSVPRRFTTRFKTNENLVLEFGPGINSVADTSIIPNPSTVGLGLTTGSNTINTAYDPTNFVTTQTYGLAPSNTTLTVSYLVGGGSKYNVLSNQLTIAASFTANGINTSKQNTVATNNPNAAAGGGDGDSIDEIRLNAMYAFSSQNRAVTQDDYLVKSLSMPSKYGKISKGYITKDDATFSNYLNADPANKDQSTVSLYVLSLNSNGNLEVPSNALLQNLQTYLLDYRMLTDSVKIKPAFVINIGCNFDVVMRPNYNGQDVIARCLTELKSFFAIDNWQINEPIVLSDIYTLLDTIDGVQTVKRVEIVNKSGLSLGYSKYSYDISGATLNGTIYPSLDPSIFEIKYLDSDIQGRVVSF
jgi:hypothetical protein